MFTMCIMQPLKGDLGASPLCRGLDVVGRNHLVARFQILGAIIHPTAPPPRFHIYRSIGSLVKPIVSCLMLLDIISLEKMKNWENFLTGTISQNFYACGEIVTTVFS